MASQKGVTICTIHAAKGLEWDVVMVPRCTNNFLPNMWIPNPQETRGMNVPPFINGYQVLADFGGPRSTWRAEPPVSCYACYPQPCMSFLAPFPNVRLALGGKRFLTWSQWSIKSVWRG